MSREIVERNDTQLTEFMKKRGVKEETVEKFWQLYCSINPRDFGAVANLARSFLRHDCNFREEDIDVVGVKDMDPMTGEYTYRVNTRWTEIV